MAKNSGGGKKFKRNKKFSNTGRNRSRILELKGPGQDYAVLDAALGDAKFECRTTDGCKRIASVPGSFRKRVWVQAGMVVLVSIREFQPDRVDILYKYNMDEIRLMTNDGMLPMMKEEAEIQPIVEEMVQTNENDDVEVEDVEDVEVEDI
jgi:translation initiation factor 1A